jgi:hypothetical protein
MWLFIIMLHRSLGQHIKHTDNLIFKTAACKDFTAELRITGLKTSSGYIKNDILPIKISDRIDQLIIDCMHATV